MTGKFDNIPTIKVLSIQENANGTANVQFDLSDEFVQWFKEDQGLKRMSKKRFNSWMVSVLENTVEKNGQLVSDLDN